MKIASLATLVCLVSSVSSQTPKTVVEVVDKKDDLSTLFVVLEAANVMDTLKGDGPFTVFAPTNKAFKALDKDMLEDYTKKPEWFAHVRSLALYHVSGGSKIMSTDIPEDGKQFPTLLVSEHEKATENITAKASQVMEADMEAGNGVVHAVNTVFMPTHLSMTLLELAKTIPGFGQVAVLFASVPGLEDTLSNDIVTIFAPNEDAVATMGAVAAGEIQLDKIIQNHMVKGLFPSTKLKDGLELTSLADEPLTISVTGKKTKVNDAEIQTFDAAASNGVVHGITAVLLTADSELPADTAP